MAKLTTLYDVFVDELRDLYNAEKQLTKALPKLAKAVSDEELRDALSHHLEETRGQIARLEQVFEGLDEPVKGKHCAGIAGIIEEGSDLLEEMDEGPVLDAAIVAGAQRAEHYEMGAYGTLIAWARAMGHGEAARLLEENLEEEKAADKKLSQLASKRLNARAQEEADAEEEDEADAPKRGSRQTAGVRASRAMAADKRR